MLRGTVVGGVHHASNGSQHGTDDKSRRNHHVGLHTHQARNTRVLGGSTHRTAQLGVIYQPHQHGQRDGRHAQNHHLRGSDHGTHHVNRRVGQECGVGLVVGLPDDHGQRLQQDGHANRSDQGCQLGAIAQRPVGDLLDDEVQRGGDHAGDQQGDDQNDEAGCAGHGLLHQSDDGPTGQCSDHHHLAVGEVDQVDDAVHHGVPQCDQRIHAAEHQPIDDLLYQNIHKTSPIFGRRIRRHGNASFWVDVQRGLMGCTES